MHLSAQQVSAFQFTLPCRERPAPAPTNPAGEEFQFTLPCRERPLTAQHLPLQRQFQFTLPCRERHGAAGSGRRAAGFNSRSRVGSDQGGADLG